MARIIETPGEVLFTYERDTFQYKVYVYSNGPKEIRIYLPKERALGLQGFKAIVSASDDNNDINRPTKPLISVAQHEYQMKMEDIASAQLNQLIKLNTCFTELVEAVRVAPNNPANEKPKRKYTRRAKKATRRKK